MPNLTNNDAFLPLSNILCYSKPLRPSGRFKAKFGSFLQTVKREQILTIESWKWKKPALKYLL